MSCKMANERVRERIGGADVDRIVEGLLLARIVDVEQVPLYHRARLDSPERELMLAVLEDALRTIVRVRSSSPASQRREAAEDLAWIESDDDSYLYGFVPICQRLQLDPAWIRRLVRARLAVRAAPHAEAA